MLVFTTRHCTAVGNMLHAPALHGRQYTCDVDNVKYAGQVAHPKRGAARAGKADQHVGRAAAGADPVVGPRRPPAGLLREGRRRATGRSAALPHLVAVGARRAAPRALAALLQRRQERGRRLVRLPARHGASLSVAQRVRIKLEAGSSLTGTSHALRWQPQGKTRSIGQVFGQ